MKKQFKFLGSFPCPHCKKLIDVRHIKQLLNEPVKAEYEEFFELRKSSQKTLEEDVKA